MDPLEIEVKYFLTDIESVRKRILDLGADCKGFFFETNIRYEDDGKSLIKNKSLLRLRKDSGTTLTFKSQPPSALKDKTGHRFKIHRELEVEISDFAIMNQILESLGFHNEQIYEKNRETFIINETLMCLDTMPYGDFLEIEGQKECIRGLETEMGLKSENRILLTYLDMFERIRNKFNLSFSDVTFENFQHLKLDLSGFIRLFEIGNSE